ncbi:MAG: UMP kinase [Patescibacteria group bacterium]|nr:UMP kinase [Patescibacteria group bacterium]
MERKFVVSLGGSLVVPNEIDLNFIRRFKNFIENKISKGKRFIIIVGGGKIARKYQLVAKKLVNVSDKDLDWLGIHSTRLNAHLLLTIFRKNAYYRVIKNPKENIGWKRKIIIAAGWKPGFSTDYDAVLLGKTYGSRVIVNLTNIDYVYDRDPDRFKDAQPFKRLSWNDYLKLIDRKWLPGMSAPFDPIASKLAKRLKFKVVIINGKRLKEFNNFIDGRDFKGTIIE